jgi:hypothetical protein
MSPWLLWPLRLFCVAWMLAVVHAFRHPDNVTYPHSTRRLSRREARIVTGALIVWGCLINYIFWFLLCRRTETLAAQCGGLANP